METLLVVVIIRVPAIDGCSTGKGVRSTQRQCAVAGFDQSAETGKNSVKKMFLALLPESAA